MADVDECITSLSIGELRILVRSEVKLLFKEEMKEELIPQIISTVNDRVDSRIHSFHKDVDKKINQIKNYMVSKLHRISKILMEG